MVEITAPTDSSAPPAVIPAVIPTASSKAAAATADADSGQLTEASEEAFAQAAAMLDEDAQPAVSDTAEPASSTEPVAETAEAAMGPPTDWAADKTTAWRNYALIGGGVAVAVAMVAIIGSSLWSSDPDDVVQFPPPIKETVSQDPANETTDPDTTDPNTLVQPDEETTTTESTTEPAEATNNAVTPADINDALTNTDTVEPGTEPDLAANVPDPNVESTTPDPEEVKTETPGNPFLFNPDAATSEDPKPEGGEPESAEPDTSGANGIATLKIEEDPLFDILGQAFPMIDNSILEEAAAKQNSVAANPQPNLAANKIAVPPDAGRAKLKKINIKARMLDPIQAIQFNQIALIDYMRFISQMSTVPISFDPLALKQAAEPANAPISVTQQGTTVQQMIRRAAEQMRMDIEVRGTDILIVQPQPTGGQPRGVRLPLADLATTDEEKQTMIDLVTHLVEPSSWEVQGGTGLVKLDPAGIAIKQTESAYFQARMLFEKLRVARGLPHKSSYPSEMFQLETATMQSGAMLQQPLTLHYVIDTPLARIISQIEKRASMTILVDWQSLHAENWAPNTVAQISVENQPLGDTLDKWLKTMDLDYRVIDAQTIQIASIKDIAQTSFLEFYPVGDLINTEAEATALIDSLKQSISGNLRFDAKSGCILALLPKQGHADLVELVMRERGK